MQADSDSENRRQSAQWKVLCLTVQVRIVVADSGGSMQAVGIRRLTGISSSSVSDSDGHRHAVTISSVMHLLFLKLRTRMYFNSNGY